jgi:Kef-type K+ transport system membrane component KefB
LIFTAGIEIKFNKLKEVGGVSTVGGLVQVVVMFFLAFVASTWLGFTGKAPIYIGLVVAFSSTMIVISLLSQKKELNSLHGRIVIGFLLIQDIVAIIALAILSSDLSWNSMAIVLVKAVGFGIFALVISRLGNVVFKKAADSREMLLLVSISFLFLFIIGSAITELSIVIGAFFAGLALANSDYKTDIESNIIPLREFFAVIFFVSLGMQLQLISKGYIILLGVLLVLALVLKPILIMFVVRLFGYKKRTSFLTGNSLAQTSEFSFIIVTLGFALGHLTQELFSTLILLTILTMALTTYFITYEKMFYLWLSWPLNILNKYANKNEELEYDVKNKNTTVLFGCHRMGSIILEKFKNRKKEIIVVDYNPQIIKALIDKKIPCIYSDFIHEEVLERVQIKNAKTIISTVPDYDDNLHLLRKVKEVNKKAIVIIVASRISEAEKLYENGADYVILPKVISGERAIRLITKQGRSEIKKLRKEHKKILKDIHNLLY